MGFVTKLDYSDNRQIRQRVETQTQLSGGTTFGVPYTELVRGVDESTTGVTSTTTGVTSTFSGNTGTTVFFFGDTRMELAGADLEPITPSNSGDTQNAGVTYTGDSTTIVDNNQVYLTYTGIGYNLIVTNFEEVTAGNYTGTTTSDLTFYSGDTADYTGSTVWLTSEDSARVKGILYANIVSGTTFYGDGSNLTGISGGGGTGTTQEVYNNDTSVNIITSGTSGAFQVQQGSGSDNDSTIEGLNGAGGTTFAVKGEGAMVVGSTANVIGSGSTNSVVLGGDDNEITDGFHNVTAGGNQNIIQGTSNLTTILGGYQNIITGSTYSSIIGSVASTMHAVDSVIVGGANNEIYSEHSTTLGGTNNIINASGGSSAIVGGGGNTILGGLTNINIIGGLSITGDTSNTTYTQHLITNGNDNAVASRNHSALDSNGNEMYSLRNEGSIVQKANTSAIADAQLINDSFSFYINSGALAGRYKDNLGVVTDLTIGSGGGGGSDQATYQFYATGTVVANTLCEPYNGAFTSPFGHMMHRAGQVEDISFSFGLSSASAIETFTVGIRAWSIGTGISGSGIQATVLSGSQIGSASFNSGGALGSAYYRNTSSTGLSASFSAGDLLLATISNFAFWSATDILVTVRVSFT